MRRSTTGQWTQSDSDPGAVFEDDPHPGPCEEVGVVERVHTLLGGVHRLTTALKVVEEVQEEVQKVKDE